MRVSLYGGLRGRACKSGLMSKSLRVHLMEQPSVQDAYASVKFTKAASRHWPPRAPGEGENAIQCSQRVRTMQKS